LATESDNRAKIISHNSIVTKLCQSVIFHRHLLITKSHGATSLEIVQLMASLFAKHYNTTKWTRTTITNSQVFESHIYTVLTKINAVQTWRCRPSWCPSLNYYKSCCRIYSKKALARLIPFVGECVATGKTM